MSPAPPPDDETLADHLALALVPGLGPKLTRATLARFGSPRGVLDATAQELAHVPMIGPKLAHKLAAHFRTVSIDEEWRLLKRHRTRVAVLGHEGYPPRLAEIDDPPHLLYIRGTLTPADGHAVAIVGSRDHTSYGKAMAERIAAELAEAGYTVISGLARGIDRHAHNGALAAKGRTIAVLAGGLARIYPADHTNFAEEVVQAGALLTETPMSVEPQAGMFPARNRIISALSLAVVVIEANAKSGALITATHAAEQGREVFALPGNADSAASAGCLELIRKGVRMVRNVEDILEDLRGLGPPLNPPARQQVVAPPEAAAVVSAPPAPRPSAPRPAPPALVGDERRLWEALTKPMHADELTRALGLDAGKLMGLAMMLEMKRAIRRRPGNVYERA